MAQGNTNIPITEHFWSLVDKADRKFARVRDVPLFGHNRNDADFQKAFRIYTQLWKLQQEHRQKLVDAGLRRWEIGEIATRIAQLYYSQYQRTSDSSYLAEAYIFYEAVFNREYFRDQGTGAGVAAGAQQQQQESALANKQLRFLARFLIVCLILARRDMVSRLLAQLKALVEECRKIFQETDFKEWRHIVQEIVRFLKYDTTFMNMRPLRYSFVFDAHPNALAVASDYKRRGLVLHDAILSSYWHNEVKFAELTLDTFRMLQSLEWEPSGQFATKSSSETSHNSGGNNRIKILQDIRDATLPPNPRKLIMYRPSITHFLTALATVCEELPPDGIILLYLSAKGGPAPKNLVSLNSEISMRAADKVAGAFTGLDISSPVSSSSNNPTELHLANKENDRCSVADQACLWLGSRGSGGSNCIYPCDLIPFTRRPLFLIIDSNQSHAFESVHGAEKGEVSAMLLSPISLPPTALDAACNGSQFTVFLTAPVQAFCMLVNLAIDRDMFDEAEKLLSMSFNTVERTLVTSDSLHPIWIEALGDPLLRRLLLRFIFCRTVLSLFAPTFDKKEFLPVCLPELPEVVSSQSIASQEAVLRLAKLFGVTDSFVFLDGIVLPEPLAGSPPMVADIDLQFSTSIDCQHI